MPRIATLNDIAIYIYGDDHNPPHVHAISGDHEALIEISSLRVIGDLPTRKLARVLAWMRTNQATLVAEWRRIQAG
ncbi:MAG: DUF4160 domain-containing protein [Deltaproteobacteria bacterium]|nr:DUF4160 domain-containing protein [Deltaproteobacteria bacterium]